MQRDTGKVEEAVLCDFGKMCRTKTDTETRLAAEIYLPPEIQLGHKNVYNQSIDVYMLAQALLLCWFPDYMAGLNPRNEKGHCQITSSLDVETESGISDLLNRMFLIRASARPTASEALADACLRDVVSVVEDVVKTSDKKRLMPWQKRK